MIRTRQRHGLTCAEALPHTFAALDASEAGRGNPFELRRTSAHTAGAFFVPAASLYGGWRGAGSRLAGSLVPVFHPRASRHPTAVESGRVGSIPQLRSHP
jgi:hypothetical protein